MKHDNNHKLDLACLDCIKKHIEIKERLIRFVKKISELEYDATTFRAYLIQQAKTILKEIENDNENISKS